MFMQVTENVKEQTFINKPDTLKSYLKIFDIEQIVAN